MVPTRRQSLTTIVAAFSGIAGCLGVEDSDVIIENRLNNPVTIDVDITRLSDMRVIVQTDRSIDAGETTAFTDPISEPDTYRIQITTQGGNTGGEKTFQVDNVDSVEISIVIGSEGVTFTKTSS
jgi:hypothetical protein